MEQPRGRSTVPQPVAPRRTQGPTAKTKTAGQSVTPETARRFSAPPRDRRGWTEWFQQTPGANALLLRAFLGVTFVVASLQKLANKGFFENSNPGSIQSQMRAAQHTSPIGALVGPFIHLGVLLGIAVAFAELAVGLATLLGLWARVAAIGGALLSLVFFLTVSFNTSPYYYGADIVFLFAWTPIALGGAGAFSLDAYFLEMRNRAVASAGPGAAGRMGAEIDRRTLGRKLGSTTLVGGLALVLAGITATIGRLLAPASSTASAPTLGGSGGSSGTGTPATTSGAPATTAKGSAGTPPGRKIGAASQVPLGGAASFTDPAQGTPAYIVHPRQGEFLGFSGVCTHQGCTVAYVKSAQQFQCPCHGSIYSALTGQVIQGPSVTPLPKITVNEGSNGQLYVE